MIPASRPTAVFMAEAGTTVSSHSMDTNQRPALSRDTVTIVGCAPSGSGRDQHTSRSCVIFASVSFPSRHLKALGVYSADARDFFRLLYRGYLARLTKNSRRRLQMAQRLLQRHRGHLGQESQFLGLFPLRQRGGQLPVEDTTLLAVPGPRTLFQRLVVDEAATA
ncbi:hypothetical protein GCM10018775_80270 [Streptomyces umbrinus]|nr:hypothetical protein GCM10018775_80270 [Streptomyces umbrinus]